MDEWVGIPKAHSIPKLPPLVMLDYRYFGQIFGSQEVKYFIKVNGFTCSCLKFFYFGSFLNCICALCASTSTWFISLSRTRCILQISRFIFRCVITLKNKKFTDIHTYSVTLSHNLQFFEKSANDLIAGRISIWQYCVHMYQTKQKYVIKHDVGMSLNMVETWFWTYLKLVSKHIAQISSNIV